jgi:hypothetical protein
VTKHNKKRGIISEAFEVMGLSIRFATGVTNDFVSGTISLIDPRRDKKGRKHVSTNY